MDISTLLATLEDAVQKRFDAERRVLSFQEYLSLFASDPLLHSRDAVRYLRDCFDHFGSYEVEKLGRKWQRFALFDGFERDESSGGHRRRERLIGHEYAQQHVYQQLNSFIRDGRANRLILLHGPNGSAKSTFVSCMMNALEHYTAHDHGAVYRFSWIFPRGKDGKTLGFDAAVEKFATNGSFAHLVEGNVEAKVSSELREHPLMLLPIEQRRVLIDKLYSDAGVTEEPPDWLRFGLLGHKNKQIFEALLTAYRGDIAKVLAHVQVERYYHSRRYRVGLVTIGPEMAVDAFERQLTADRSLGSLPASMSSLTLFETYGQLVDGSGGLVEYSDLLKRPIDAWRYLLLAIESGEVSLSFSKVPLNTVLFANTNELHLAAFKGHHEYRSFRGRFQLLRMPYLLSYRDEQAIYDTHIVPQLLRPAAPHASYVIALWAVLTRLVRPKADRYKRRSLGRLASQLQPVEKAELYADGTVPPRMSSEDSVELLAGIGDIVDETFSTDNYEGLSGASPREIRSILLEAAQDAKRQTLTPLSVLEKIESFCERNDFDFLKQDKDGGYFDHRGFVDQVRYRWIDRVDEELRTATGLVEESRYSELFVRYVMHVSYWVKGERIFNPVTGKDENPDLDLMSRVEAMLDASNRATEFRRDLIGTLAAHALDNPGEKVDYAKLFPRYLAKVRDAYFAENKKQLADIAEGVLRLLDQQKTDKPLDAHQLELIESTKAAFETRFGYNAESLREALGELLAARYHTP